MDFIKRNKTIVMLFVVVALFLIFMALTGCSSYERSLKSWESNWSGGLDRTLILYDYDGNEIQRWEGKMDLDMGSSSDGSSGGNRILFDLDGKRTQIAGGIVVVQEN